MEHKEERVIEGPHHREQGISKEVDHLHPEKQIEDYENQSEEEGEERADDPSLRKVNFSEADLAWLIIGGNFLKRKKMTTIQEKTTMAIPKVLMSFSELSSFIVLKSFTLSILCSWLLISPV